MTLEELEIIVRANVDEATSKLEELKAQMEDTTSEGFKEITQESEKMGEAVKQSAGNIDKMIPQLAGMTTKAVTGSTAMAGLSKSIVTTSTALKTAFPIILAISVVIMAIIKAINSLKEKLDSIVKTIKQGLKTTLEIILNLLQKIIVISSRIIGVLGNLTRNGLNNLVQASAELNDVLSQIQGKTIQLGNALASAVAPVIQALTPLIISMLNALISVANILGEITASLFGNATVYKKATTVTTNYATALGKANKEQQKTLAGFDELNVLADKNSGSGGVETPIAQMFEPTEIRKEIQDYTKQIKEAFKKAKQQVEQGDYEGAGDTIGKEFNRKIEELPTYEWGQNVARKINQAMEIVIGFLENDPLGKIGKKIGEFIRGWIEEIDPKDVGRFLAEIVNNAFSFVANFFSEANAEDGLKKLGEKISQALITFIKSLDSDDIANAINETVIALLDLAIGFFGGWINGDGQNEVNTKIDELMSKIKWKEILEKLVQAVILGWYAIESFKWNLKLTILREALGWIGGELKEKVVEKVQEIWQSIFNTADENGVTLLDRLKGAWKKVAEWWELKKKEIGKSLGTAKTFFKNIVNGVIEIVEKGINGIIKKINKIKFEMPDFLGGYSWQPSIPEISIPRLANGGVLTKPTTVLAGEYAGATNNPEIVAPQKLLLETSTQANIPVMNSIEELGDKMITALNSIGVYAEFDYSKLKVGLDNENYRAGGKLYGI